MIDRQIAGLDRFGRSAHCTAWIPRYEHNKLGTLAGHWLGRHTPQLLRYCPGRLYGFSVTGMVIVRRYAVHVPGGGVGIALPSVEALRG